MGNKMYNKPMYKCAICDAIYDTVAERMHCEAACIKKAEEEAQKLAEEKLKIEKATRKAEVENAVKTTYELIKAYVNDYGSFEVYNMLSDDNDNLLLWPSRFLQNWLF